MQAPLPSSSEEASRRTMWGYRRGLRHSSAALALRDVAAALGDNSHEKVVHRRGCLGGDAGVGWSRPGKRNWHRHHSPVGEDRRQDLLHRPLSLRLRQWSDANPCPGGRDQILDLAHGSRVRKLMGRLSPCRRQEHEVHPRWRCLDLRYASAPLPAVLNARAATITHRDDTRGSTCFFAARIPEVCGPRSWCGCTLAAPKGHAS